MIKINKNKIIRLRQKLSKVFWRYIQWRHSWKTTTAGITIVFTGLMLGIVFHTSAATATMVPNGDVTSTWATLVGSSGTCAGGTHCDHVDEGTTADDNDFASTGSSLTGPNIEEFALDAPTGIASATQVVINVRLRSITLGSTADSVGIALRVNNTLQAVTTVNMTTTITNYQVTYNGTWTQADVGTMQIYLIRNVLGSGSPANQDDNVAVYNAYATLTYTVNQTFEQAGYRWYDNQDASTGTTFADVYGTDTFDSGESIITNSSGDYITGGTSNNNATLNKYDSAGNLIWAKEWGGSGNDSAREIIQTSDGGYAMTGSTASYGSNGSMFLAKFDSNGTRTWDLYWGGTSGDVGISLVQTSDGGFAVTGNTFSFGIAGDMFVAKYSADGTLLWDTTWGGSSADNAYSIIQTNDNGLVIAGTESGLTASQDAVIAKFTSSGTLSWDMTYGGSNADNGFDIVQSSDGGLVLTGSLGISSTDAFIAKFNSSGSLLWDATWSGGSSDLANGIIASADGGYAIVGTTSSFAATQDMFIAKFNSSGSLSWDFVYGGNASDPGYDIVQASDGGYAAIGSTTSWGPVNDNISLIKVNSSGTIAGCSSAPCQDPSATSADPTASTSDPSATIADPAATGASPTGTLGTTTLTKVVNVAVDPNMNVGSPLGGAGLNTPATAPTEGTIFRLRLGLHVGSAQLDAGTGGFKLRYAPKTGGSCSASTYADVTDNTVIRYANNTTAGSGLGLTTNANDPTHSSDALVRQTYQETGTTTFSNTTAVPAGQDGIWDFALTAYHSLQSDVYCFKVVKSDNSNIDTYTVYPEITMPSATFSQVHSRWYDTLPSGGTTFLKTWGGSSAEAGNSITATGDGGYAVTGFTSTFGTASSFDMFIAKYASDGTLSWNKTWGSSATTTRGYGIVQTSDGGYAVTGSTDGFSSSYDMFIVKYTSSGVVSWNKTWASVGVDKGNSIIQTSDGGYAVAGTSDFSTGGGETFLAKYDSSGNLSWDTTRDVGNSDEAFAVIQTSDGGYALTGGYGWGGDGNRSSFIAKYNSSGAMTWNTLFSRDTFSDTYGAGLIQTSDGGYVVTGYSDTIGPSFSTDMYIAKFDSSGSQTWVKQWGGSGNDFGYGITSTSDGGFAVTGSTTSYGAGTSDVFVVKYDSSGNLIWNKTIGGTSADEGYAITQTSNGSIAVTGYSVSFRAGTSEMFLAVLSSSGDLPGCSATNCQSPLATTGVPSMSGSVLVTTTVSPTASENSTLTGLNVGTPSATQSTFVAPSQPIGNPLTPQNGVLDYVSQKQPVTLKIAVATNGAGTAASAQTYKLQFAALGANPSCSAVGSFADVTTSTALRYYDDTRYTGGSGIGLNANDPTDSGRTMAPQTYQESNNFTNSGSPVYADQDGLWQFMLTVDSTSYRGATYCIRVATSGGTLLSATNIAELKVSPDMSRLMRGGNSFDLQGRRNYIDL